MLGILLQKQKKKQEEEEEEEEEMAVEEKMEDEDGDGEKEDNAVACLICSKGFAAESCKHLVIFFPPPKNTKKSHLHPRIAKIKRNTVDGKTAAFEALIVEM